MSKAKRKRLEKDSAKQQLAESRDENAGQGKRIILIVSAVFVALVILIIGVNHYFSDDQKYYRIDVIQVDDQKIDMDYFVKRCYASGMDPLAALSGITRELVVREEAEEYGITVSSLEVEQFMMENATAGSDVSSITQSEFNEWLKQRLNETGFSEKEYRAIAEASLLSQKIYDIIVASTPTAVEQIRISVIALDSEESAIAAKARIDAGEDFAAVARDVSLESTSAELGGDVGWVPRGTAWDGRYDTLLFDQLAIGAVSEPTVYYDTSTTTTASTQYKEYYLMMVTEKSDSHEIDEQYLDNYYADAYEAWMTQAIENHEVHYNGISAGFDSETYSWINWQVQKLTGEDDEEE